MAKDTVCCATCNKTASEVPDLKFCGRCKGIRYCSPECQKADWKTHKKVCKESAENASNAPPKSTTNDKPLRRIKGLEKRIPNPFTRLDNHTYLHDRPEHDVYKLLIDTFRMREADNKNFEGKVDQDSVYTGNKTSLPGFQRFLKLAAQRKGLLPPWWDEEKKKECEQMGLDHSKENWADLSCRVEKHGVINHYDDQKMPMQLRMLGETVYKTGPGGQDGSGMRALMMLQESPGGVPGGGHMALFSNV